LAGKDGACCNSGDGGPATSAQLSYPWDVAADAADNIFISDAGNHRIRRVSPDGVISTVTASAQSYGLFGLTVDQSGTLFIADSPNHVIRRVSLDGTSTIVAGTGKPGYSGDGGPATDAQLAWPTRVTTDRAGNMFIMDSYGSRIRKVSPEGIITSFAGIGNGGFYGALSGDGGPAVDAQLNTDGGCDGPGGGMAVDVVGDLYFADTYNNRIRQVDPNGIIHTVAGNDQYAFSGDGGPLNNAGFAEPFSMAFDPAGNLFIADYFNNRIRKVTSRRNHCYCRREWVVGFFRRRWTVNRGGSARTGGHRGGPRGKHLHS
jgi:sugar lactone lactonase YvrE